jgi:Cupin domain.
MDHVPFDDAETYNPEPGWARVALAGSEAFSFEWFEKRPGHASPMHSHPNEQVCICIEGELSVETENGETATIGPYDSVRFESDEPHIVANQTEEQAIGIDVFAPGRSFDFWLNRL